MKFGKTKLSQKQFELLLWLLVSVICAIGFVMQPLGFLGGLLAYHLLRRFKVIK